MELREGLDGDASEVILDLRGVSFIDSTGVRLLVFAAAHSRSKGDRLRMRRGSEGGRTKTSSKWFRAVAAVSRLS